jgi:tetratricopeptide (TPR) repeat protein
MSGGGEAAVVQRAIRRASDLTRRGHILANGSDGDAAMIAAREAVALWRALLVAEDGHTGHLAGALLGLGIQLACAGELDEAAEVSREAIRIRRRGLNGTRSLDAGRFARALLNLGAWLGEDELHVEAIEATAEALALWRPLARANPRYGVEMAEALRRLAGYLLAQGRQEDAAAAAHEAVERYRPLVRADPGLTRDLTEALVLLTRSMNPL